MVGRRLLRITSSVEVVGFELPAAAPLVLQRQRGLISAPRLRSGRALRIDMALPAVHGAVEVDIHPAHEMREGLTNDIRRDRQM